MSISTSLSLASVINPKKSPIYFRNNCGPLLETKNPSAAQFLQRILTSTGLGEKEPFRRLFSTYPNGIKALELYDIIKDREDLNNALEIKKFSLMEKKMQEYKI